jgi:hypothetical protein
MTKNFMAITVIAMMFAGTIGCCEDGESDCAIDSTYLFDPSDNTIDLRNTDDACEVFAEDASWCDRTIGISQGLNLAACLGDHLWLCDPSTGAGFDFGPVSDCH